MLVRAFLLRIPGSLAGVAGFAAVAGVALSTTACSSLTRPDEIQIFAEPLPVTKAAPAVAGRPGAPGTPGSAPQAPPGGNPSGG